jgi:hypothetical protein
MATVRVQVLVGTRSVKVVIGHVLGLHMTAYLIFRRKLGAVSYAW